eukprot:02217.XXX_18908_19722_1 [CDS] Oithona nana genome sequencing.
MPEVRMSDSEEEVSSGHVSRNSLNPSPNRELDTFKHPLQNKWTLWYYKNDRSKDWESNQKQVITFSTVEDFWALYNHIENASKLGTGCDYSLFKEGVKPMWEDSHNEHGGKWLLQMDKRSRMSALDGIWLEIMMCLIGEAFGDSGSIVNGAVVNIRGKIDKISVWLADSVKSNAIMAIGQEMKARLRLADRELVFESHKDSMNRSSSSVKAKFIV